ncbi:hypothetical protein DXG01_013054, partial [Tephrocybe rancida]
MGEAQHHWTNSQSGIRLPLVEAILSAKEIDERVAEEVKAAFSTGILTNKQTELFHRTSRNSQCHSATARKARIATKVQTVNGELREKIEEEKTNRRESTLRQQELQDQLDEANGKRPKPRTAGSKKLSLADMSSSGRVKSSKPTETTKQSANTTIDTVTPQARVDHIVSQPQQLDADFFDLFRVSDGLSGSQIEPASPFATDPLSLGGPFYELPIPNTTGNLPVNTSPASLGQESMFNSGP